MFESLSDKLKRTLKNLRGEGVLTREHIEAALREIRLALLEADVNYKVAKDFIASVKEKAEGQQVWLELKPSEQVVKIVFDELVELLGGTSSRLVAERCGGQASHRRRVDGRTGQNQERNASGGNPFRCGCDDRTGRCQIGRRISRARRHYRSRADQDGRRCSRRCRLIDQTGH